MEAQQNLERHLADIEQMNQDKSMFLQYIGHELNTPINWIGAADSLDSPGRGRVRKRWMCGPGKRGSGASRESSAPRHFDLSDRHQPPLQGSCQPMDVTPFCVTRRRG